MEVNQGSHYIREALSLVILTLFNLVLFIIVLRTFSNSAISITTYNTLLLSFIVIIGFICGYLGNTYVTLLEVLSITLIVTGSAYVLLNTDIHFILQYLLIGLVSYSVAVLFALRKKGSQTYMMESLSKGIRLITKPVLRIKDLATELLGLVGLVLISYYVITLVLNKLFPMYAPLLAGYVVTNVTYLGINPYVISLITILVVTIFISALKGASGTLSLRISKSASRYALISLITYFIPLSMPLLIIALATPRQAYSLITRSKGVEVTYDICLGKVIDAVGGKEVLSRELCIELGRGQNNHVLVVGATGSGKTTLVRYLLRQLSDRSDVRYLVFDVHGEYLELNAFKLNPKVNKINILNLGINDKEILVEEITGILAEVFRLGDIQLDNLRKVLLMLLNTSENPTVDDLISLINNVIKDKELCSKYGVDPSTLKSLIPYLTQLRGVAGKSYEWINAEDIMNRNVVINLSTVSNKYLIRVYTEVLARMLFNNLRKNPKYRYVIVFEEAHNFITKSGNDIITKILREGRKFNLNLVAITQSLHDIPEAPLSNFKWVIMLPSLLQSQYIGFIKSILNEEFIKNIRELLSNLSQGSALVVSQSEKVVYHIKTYISE